MIRAEPLAPIRFSIGLPEGTEWTARSVPSERWKGLPHLRAYVPRWEKEVLEIALPELDGWEIMVHTARGNIVTACLCRQGSPALQALGRGG